MIFLKKYCLLTYFLLSCLSIVQSQTLGKFELNERIIKIQEQIFELKLKDAQSNLDILKKEKVNNLAVHWLSEQVLFYKLFISDDENLFKSELNKYENILKDIQKIKTNDGYQRFVLSDYYMHLGLLKSIFNQQFSAGTDIKKANNLLLENEKLFPNFLEDNKNFAIMNALSEAVPKNYQWIASLLGFNGNIEKSEKLIEDVLNSNANLWIKTETAFFYGLILHHQLKQTEKAKLLIDSYTKEYKKYPLLLYIRALFTNYSGKNNELYDLLKNKPANSTLQQPFYYLDYLLGVSKLKRLEKDADIHFKIYTTFSKSKNYIKSCYKYLAWHNTINQNDEQSKIYYLMTLKFGKTDKEEDKEAQREAEENLIWQSDLLKARLLFDGQNYQESLKILNQIKYSQLKIKKFKLEYHYRFARNFQETNFSEKAIEYFKKTIELGKNEIYYYAAYSALQMAYIYEEKNNITEAKKYFLMAKNNFPKNEQYRNSIEQKAKAGLKRLE